MKPSWNRDEADELDVALRAGRPEPSAEVTQAIAQSVRPRKGVLKRRIGRVPVVIIAGVAALAITPVVAVGVGGNRDRVAALEQYEEEDVVICVNGFATHTVSPEFAAELVALGVATYGPC